LRSGPEGQLPVRWGSGEKGEGSRGSLKQAKSPGAAKRPLSTIVLRWERLTVRVRMKAEFYAPELPRNRTSALRALTQRTSSAAMRSSRCRSASYPHCHTADRNLRPSHSAKDRQSSPCHHKGPIDPRDPSTTSFGREPGVEGERSRRAQFSQPGLGYTLSRRRSVEGRLS
jgi:hypothetical protein